MAGALLVPITAVLTLWRFRPEQGAGVKKRLTKAVLLPGSQVLLPSPSSRLLFQDAFRNFSSSAHHCQSHLKPFSSHRLHSGVLIRQGEYLPPEHKALVHDCAVT